MPRIRGQSHKVHHSRKKNSLDLARAFLVGSVPSPLAPTNHAVGFGPSQPTERAIQDASLLEQGGTEALQLDENVRLGDELGSVDGVGNQTPRSEWMAKGWPRVPIRAAS